MDEGAEYNLWIEKISYLFGFGRISEAVFGVRDYSAYLYVFTIMILDVVVLSTIGYIIHDGQIIHPLIDIPWFGLIPIAFAIGVFGMRKNRSIYSQAINNSGKVDGKINVSTPNNLRILIFGAAIFLYFLIILPNFPEILNNEGQIIGAVKWGVIIPFVYVIIIAEFFVIYLHALFFLPISIAIQNISLDFSDPKNLGGMGKVGELIMSATMFYYLCLAIWTATQLMGPLTGAKGAIQSGPGIDTIIFFTIAWMIGGVLFLFALWVIHRHMYTQKEKKIYDIMGDIEDSGSDAEVFPYTNPGEDTVEEVIEYVHEDMRLRKVEKTKTYPIDEEKLIEMFASVLFPVLLQSISIAL